MTNAVTQIGRIFAALVYAAEAHKNCRGLTKEAEPYINHLIHVAGLTSVVLHRTKLCDSYYVEIIQAAILHDILEDTHITYENLIAQFGEEVANLVQENTDSKHHTKEEAKENQILKMPHKSHWARVIKMADVVSNTNNSPKFLLHKKEILWYLDAQKRLIEAASGTSEFLEELFNNVYSIALKEVGERPDE